MRNLPTWRNVQQQGTASANLAVAKGMQFQSDAGQGLQDMATTLRDANIESHDIATKDNDAMVQANISKLKTLGEWEGAEAQFTDGALRERFGSDFTAGAGSMAYALRDNAIMQNKNTLDTFNASQLIESERDERSIFNTRMQSQQGAFDGSIKADILGSTTLSEATKAAELAKLSSLNKSQIEQTKVDHSRNLKNEASIQSTIASKQTQRINLRKAYSEPLLKKQDKVDAAADKALTLSQGTYEKSKIPMAPYLEKGTGGATFEAFGKHPMTKDFTAKDWEEIDLGMQDVMASVSTTAKYNPDTGRTMNVSGGKAFTLLDENKNPVHQNNIPKTVFVKALQRSGLDIKSLPSMVDHKVYPDRLKAAIQAEYLAYLEVKGAATEAEERYKTDVAAYNVTRSDSLKNRGRIENSTNNKHPLISGGR